MDPDLSLADFLYPILALLAVFAPLGLVAWLVTFSPCPGRKRHPGGQP